MKSVKLASPRHGMSTLALGSLFDYNLFLLFLIIIHFNKAERPAVI